MSVNTQQSGLPVFAPAVPEPPSSPKPCRRGTVVRFPEPGLVGVALLIVIVLSTAGGSLRVRDRASGEVTTVNKFLRADNIDLVMKNTSFFAIMAAGLTFVILTGGIDLSVGLIYCLAAVGGAMFLSHFGPSGSTGTPWLVVPGAILLCLAVGVVCGLINGLGVVFPRLYPFIITLGTMAIFRGVAFVMSKAQSFTDLPTPFTDGLIRYRVGGLYPVPMTIMIGVIVVAAIYLRYFVGGRHIFEVGGNEQAAKFSGLPMWWIKLKVYAVSGLCAGIAAVIMLGYYGSASSDAGKGYELDVIAAAVVGGASLVGGRGTMLEALLGALLILLIGNGIIILDVDQNYSQIIVGAIIVVAVVLERLNNARRARALARAAGWR